MKQYTLDFEKPIRELELKINELEEFAKEGKIGLDGEIERLRQKAEKQKKDIYSKLNRWQHVQLARHPNRPYAQDYIDLIFESFEELHGDRNFRDDKAIIAGLGKMKKVAAESSSQNSGSDLRVAVIAQQKGRGTKDNLKRNFAMPHPEGYRKALRVMHLAEKFNLPILTLIDTPGAYPGLGAEERGQAAAIAENLFAMAQLSVPLVAVIIGEGGSGGALALGVADRVFMLEHSVYSVITPEGCASILYRDAAFAETAAEAMKLTSTDLLKFRVIDKVIKEPIGGAHTDVESVAKDIRAVVTKAFIELQEMEGEDRIQTRIEKYSEMGRWNED